MIKILFIIFTIGYVYATEPSSNIEEVTKQKTEKILEEYKNALLLYKEKKFQEAYNELNILFQSNLDDANINFYLGRTAFELEKYDEAIIAYERVLFSKPENTRAKLELGRAFFMTKQYSEAKKYFLEVRQDPNTPTNIKITLEKFLDVINEQNQQYSTIKKHLLSGIVLFGLNYDSNVQNTADAHVNKYTGLNYLEQKIKDIAHQEVIIVNHRYNLDEQSAIKNDFLIYSKEFHDDKITDENVKFLSYTPTYSQVLASSKVLVDYSLFLDRLWVESDTYMYSYGIFPKLTYPIQNNFFLESSLKLQKKRYTQALDKSKNSVVKEISFGSKYLYSANTLFGLKCVFSSERETDDKNSQRIDINKNIYELQANAIYSINKDFTLNPFFSLKSTHYKDPNSFNNNEKQKDKEYKFGFLSTYTYSPKWLFQFGGDYTKVDSNLQVSEYNKHTLTFNIIRPF